MLIEPLSVIRRLLASVLRVRNLVLAGLSLVTGACILLVVFVFLLTFRLRQNEFDTLRKIGASTRQMSGMILVEMGVVLTTGATIGLALTWLMGRFDQILLRWLIWPDVGSTYITEMKTRNPAADTFSTSTGTLGSGSVFH